MLGPQRRDYSLLDALLVMVGPTAVGKGEVAVDLAGKLRAEVISADSRKIYRGMNIGTAKPSLEVRRKIPYHLIDVASPDEVFSAAEFKKRASSVIKRIQEENKLPLLVGGSGLYIRAVVDGIFSGPGRDQNLRARLREREKDKGEGALYQELKRLDPASASRLHSHDARRVIRALEVYYLSGKPISSHQREAPYSPLSSTVMVGLRMKRSALYQLTNRRVDAMIQEGLVQEVEGLLKEGYGEDLPSMEGLGYRQIIGYLKGKYSREEAVRLVKRDTRRFAKRQLSWFNKDPRIIWLDREKFPTSGGASEKIVEILLEKLPQAEQIVR
ncbi:tRNA (adenosine(37)-N6)-dimethylallyltransferase MiaA [Candidatus Aerophobetes bacterium]|uniref:tRNA dimethylallyltransferase n=1 Tax=Aerophobetes bacterium TaxID=2030807 RepID=A0A523W358_UNCAE|nr:MAG: tRNA (adenosine(37)-N6)-dimethylallyltransferase MiaA [Candidatus Aerophobetes bacterium]